MSAGRQRSRSLLIITGSMGSGKTTLMAEASDILALRGIPHAAIDLDIWDWRTCPLKRRTMP